MTRVLIVIAFLVAATARAGAQTEYTLGPGGWEKTAEPQPGTDAAVIASARTLLAEGQFSAARRLLSKWIDTHKYTDSPWLPEAYLLRGDARQGMGDEYLALYDYKKITVEFSGTSVFVTSLERQLAIAIKYVHGMKRRFMGIRWYGAKSEGEEILARVQEQLPRSVLAERAAIEQVRFYYRESELEMCSIMCDIFMQNFRRSPYRAEVLEARINSNWAMHAGPEYDGSYLTEARELIRQFMAEYPARAAQKGMDESAIARIDESAAEQMMTSAKWYLRRGEAAEARFTLRRLIRDYGTTVAASRAYQILVEKGWAGAAPAGAAPAVTAPGEGPAAGEDAPAGEGETP